MIDVALRGHTHSPAVHDRAMDRRPARGGSGVLDPAVAQPSNATAAESRGASAREAGQELYTRCDAFAPRTMIGDEIGGD